MEGIPREIITKIFLYYKEDFYSLINYLLINKNIYNVVNKIIQENKDNLLYILYQFNRTKDIKYIDTIDWYDLGEAWLPRAHNLLIEYLRISKNNSFDYVNDYISGIKSSGFNPILLRKVISSFKKYYMKIGIVKFIPILSHEGKYNLNKIFGTCCVGRSYLEYFYKNIGDIGDNMLYLCQHGKSKELIRTLKNIQYPIINRDKSQYFIILELLYTSGYLNSYDSSLYQYLNPLILTYFKEISFNYYEDYRDYEHKNVVRKNWDGFDNNLSFQRKFSQWGDRNKAFNILNNIRNDILLKIMIHIKE